MLGLLKKVIGDTNDKELKRMSKYVLQINRLEEQIKELSDSDLRSKTDEFKERYNNGESLEDLLPETFAVVREASARVLQMRHFDVQLIGGITLHEGKISEMKTGEGKTLVATLPAYLNALTGKGVHIITVNEYLATRDRNQMGKIFEFLGLTVGLNLNGITAKEKQEAYNADITYGTNNEFGFDYLRDNMVLYIEHLAQRPLNYAIIDEVDSILIDEARTPLIISGKAAKSTSLYAVAAQLVRKFKEEQDYILDEKTNSVVLTEVGVGKAEKAFSIDNLFDTEHIILNHHITQSLKAHVMMKRDRDYVVQDGEIIIVDDFTGRLMNGRRYSDGLHQSIEAKEGLNVQNESMTLATITIQNYFRMYKKLAGMTGTAKTEEEEFRKIYGLDVVVIPTNMPMIREDHPDVVFKSEGAKYRAAINEIEKRYQVKQPVLVGTISIEKSEILSELLTRKGIPHNVLNAKFHAQEAEIVADAGLSGMITIATNMAGRGTDIVLGQGVAGIGGLHIIGTERHESRRIDNQLRGRSGRQGDPGSTQFFLSLQDDLMRKFGADHIMTMMDKLGMEEDQPIESKLVSRALEQAQKRVEGNNFDTRRIVLQYDDVMNKHREVIYGQRREVLGSENLRAVIISMIMNYVERIVHLHCPEELITEEWELKEIVEHSNRTFLTLNTIVEKDIWGKEPEEIIEFFRQLVEKEYCIREEELGERMREFEKVILLRAVDSKWMDHIDAMDQLRQGIHLRAYGQSNPLQEYQKEAFEMFQGMIQTIEEDVATYIMKAQVHNNLQREAVAVGQAVNSKEEVVKKAPVVSEDKIGRNEVCPCGSGKKYKNCCGR
ncbi:MAG: preprotein translocase subunit SecA [Vulcanibacillus sp.]